MTFRKPMECEFTSVLSPCVYVCGAGILLHFTPYTNYFTSVFVVLVETEDQEQVSDACVFPFTMSACKPSILYQDYSGYQKIKPNFGSRCTLLNVTGNTTPAKPREGRFGKYGLFVT